MQCAEVLTPQWNSMRRGDAAEGMMKIHDSGGGGPGLARGGIRRRGRAGLCSPGCFSRETHQRSMSEDEGEGEASAAASEG